MTPNPQRRRTVVIVDDHPLVREGMILRISSQPDLEVCGEASTAAGALHLLMNGQPDLLIVDVSLQDGSGIDLVGQVTVLYPNVKSLVVSSFVESLYGERALRAGALGYLNKQETNANFLIAVRTVLEGERFASPELIHSFELRESNAEGDQSDAVYGLSNRELEIFRLIGQGKSSREIAGHLHISTHTIDTHRGNIKKKIGARTGAELNQKAVQWVLENG